MSKNELTPVLSLESAEKIAAQEFGIRGQAKFLPSYIDCNFRITDEQGTHFVLKVANTAESFDSLDFQNQGMAWLFQRGICCSRPLPANNGELMITVNDELGRPVLARILTYLPGSFFVDLDKQAPALWENFGVYMAKLNLAFRGFEHPAMEWDLNWDSKNTMRMRDYLHYVKDPQVLRLLTRVLDDFERDVVPVMDQFRKSIIHNDANDYNVVVDGDDISGIIDFGDMIYSATVFDVGITLSYLMLRQEDPLITAYHFLKGFQRYFPLEPQEIAVLFPLIRARMCISVTMAAEQAALAPSNEYATASVDVAIDLLQKLDEIHTDYAQAVFRSACGLPPFPSSVPAWLELNQAQFAPVVLPSPAKYFHLPLSGKQDSDFSEKDVSEQSNLLFAALDGAGADLGFGSYDEDRSCYTGEQFMGAEPRTIHIGIDLFAKAGTDVHTPLDAVVHSFADNDIPLDYGPTVILEHRSDDGTPFYTLYGHLSRCSLEGLSEGQEFKAGTAFAKMGDHTENGGWIPHLHFQLMLHPFDYKGTYPGVACKTLRQVWLSLCPDPNLILNIEPLPNNKNSMRAERTESLGPSLSLSYGEPLRIVRGEAQFLFDDQGQAYLDCVNNVCHVGHAHPRVVAAASKQMALLNTNTRYLHDHILKYAQRLSATMPDPLEVCFLVCSGSEANELALRMARAYTGANDIIVVDGAYHGNTGQLVSLSPYKFNGPGGSGQSEGVHVAEMPDTFRGRIKRDDANPGEKYAQAVVEILTNMGDRKPAAFLCESLLSCGGQIELPERYLEHVYAAVRKAGGVCIADEVQVGFGRIGDHFWGFQAQQVVPDIVTMGKPIGNGHPMAAVITTRAIAEAFANGMEYFNTFGGNPVSCATGLAVLNVIEDQQLQENARLVGNHLKAGLRRLQEQFPIIGDVRGLGLFLGIEFVHEGGRPAAAEAKKIVEALRARHILLSTDGPLNNVIKIKPPLVFTKNDADRVVTEMKQVIAGL